MRVSFDENNNLKMVNAFEAVLFPGLGIGIAFREAGTMYNDRRDYQNDYNDIAIFAVPECDSDDAHFIENDYNKLLETGYLRIDIDMYAVYHTANTALSIEQYAEQIKPVIAAIHS